MAAELEPGAFEEPIRILSDLHLAHPGSRVLDALQLAPLLDGVGTVIFNGDTHEERMRRFRPKAEEQLALLRRMCGEAGAQMVTVRGNHDPYTPEHGALDLCGGKVFVTHGDILYRDVSPWSRNARFAREARHGIEQEYPPGYRNDLETTLEVSRRVTQEMQVHQPRAKPGLMGKIKTMLLQTWPPSRPLTILKVWFEAPRLAAEIQQRYRPQSKVLVVGHTHRAFIQQRNGQVQINTGAFLPMSKAYAVDIAGDTLAVKEIRERSGNFVATDELARFPLEA